MDRAGCGLLMLLASCDGVEDEERRSGSGHKGNVQGSSSETRPEEIWSARRAARLIPREVVAVGWRSSRARRDGRMSTSGVEQQQAQPAVIDRADASMA